MCIPILFALSTFFAPFLLVAQEIGPKTIFSNNTIEKAIKSLSVDTPFHTFHLNFSPEVLAAFKDIEINDSKEYNNYANLASLKDEIKVFLRSLGKQDDRIVETVSQSIDTVVRQCVKASGKETAWVALRAFIPSQSYDVPRWHTDGFYYEPFRDQYKFAIILKGPGTLFYKLPNSMRKKFDSLQLKDDRKALAQLMNRSELLTQLNINQGAVFIVGEEHSAAAHSEPPIHEQRLYLSILPGSKSQIEEWKHRCEPS